MKKLMFVVVSVLFAASVHAAEIKIGYVDGLTALRNSEEGKRITKIIQEMYDAKQAIIDEKGKELKGLEEEMAKQASILNPDALKEKRDQREKMAKELQRLVKDSEEELQKKQADLMGDLVKKIRVIIGRIGAEEGYAIIFEKKDSAILYIPEKSNLTEKVIAKFNEAVKAGEFKK